MGMECEGERHPGAGEPFTRQQAGFCRADEDQAVRARQAYQRLRRAALRVRVEIDQQVAAEHHVVGRLGSEQ
ncbi:hypothetical protein D3C86_2227430 [compost metagenome]